MPLFLTAYAFAILFCVHAFRTGRDRYWLFILLAFPRDWEFNLFHYRAVARNRIRP